MIDELRTRLATLPTNELVAILRARDLEQWRPEVFPIVEAILGERGVDVAALQMDPGDVGPAARYGALV